MIKRVALFLFVMISSLYATDDEITRGGGSFVGTQNQVFYKTITPSDLTCYPYEITTPGRYIVTRDFYHHAFDAEKEGQPLIRINASNVTIDFQTFSLYQGTSTSEKKSDLIWIDGDANNVVLMNGTLAQANGFGIKVTGGASNIVISDMRIMSCSAGAIGIMGNIGSGEFIITTPSRNVLLQRVMCHNNARDNRAIGADQNEDTPGVQYYLGDLVSTFDDSQLFTVGAAGLVAANVYGLRIEDCSFSNTGVAQSLPVYGVYLDKCQYVSMQNTDISLTRSDNIVCGLYIENSSDITLEKVHAGKSISNLGQAFGVVLRSCQGVQCKDVQTTLHTGYGVTGLWVWNSNGVTLEKTLIQNNTATGSLFIGDPTQNDPSYFPVYRYDVQTGLWEQNTNYSINLNSAYTAFNNRRLEIPANTIDPEISDDETFVYTKWQQLMNAYGALDVALEYWKDAHYAYGLRILNSEYVHVDDIQVIDTNAQYSSAWGIVVDGGQGNMIQNALVQGTQGFSEFDPSKHATSQIQFLFEGVLDEDGALNDDETICMLSRAAAMEIKNCAQGTFVRHCVCKQTANSWGAGYGLFLNNSSKASVFDVKYEHNLGYDFGGGLVNRKYDSTDVIGGSTFFVNGWQDNFNHNWLLFWSDGGKFSVKHVYPGDLNLANNIGPYDNLVIIFDSVTQQTITCPADELSVNNYIVSLPVVQATFIPFYTDSGTHLSDFTFQLPDNLVLSDTMTLQSSDFSVSSIVPEISIIYDITGTIAITGTGVIHDSSNDSDLAVTITGVIYVAIDENGNLSINTRGQSSNLLVKNADADVIAVLDVQEFAQTKMHAVFQLDYTVDQYNGHISLYFDENAFIQTSGGYTLSNPSLLLNGHSTIILDFGVNYALAITGTIDVTDVDGNTTTCTVDYPTGILGLTVGSDGVPFMTEGMFIHASLGSQSPLQYIVATDVHFVQNISVDLNFNYNSTNTTLAWDAHPFTLNSGTYSSGDLSHMNGLRVALNSDVLLPGVIYRDFDSDGGTQVYIGGSFDLDEETVYIDAQSSYVYLTNTPAVGSSDPSQISVYADAEHQQKICHLIIDDIHFQDTILGRLHFNYDATHLTFNARPLLLNDLEIEDYELYFVQEYESESIAYSGFDGEGGTQIHIGGGILFPYGVVGYIDPSTSYTYITDTPSQGSTSNGVLYVYADSEYTELMYIIMLGENIFTNYSTARAFFMYNQGIGTVHFIEDSLDILSGQYDAEDFDSFALTLGTDPNPEDSTVSYLDFGSGTKVYIGGTFELQGETVYVNGNTSYLYMTDEPGDADDGVLYVFAEAECITPVCTIALTSATFVEGYTFNFYWNNVGKMIFSYDHPVNGFEWANIILNGQHEIYVLSQGSNEITVSGTLFDASNNTLLYVDGVLHLSWSGVPGEQPTLDVNAGDTILALYTDADLYIPYTSSSLFADACTFVYDPNNADVNNQELYAFGDGYEDATDDTSYLGHMNFYYDENQLFYAFAPITISSGGAYTHNDLSVFNLKIGTTVNPTASFVLYNTFNETDGTLLYIGGTCMLDISGTPTLVYIGGANSYVYVTSVPGQGLTTNGVLTVYSDSARTPGNELFTVRLGRSTFEQVIFGNVSFQYASDTEILSFASPGLHLTGGQFVQDDFSQYHLRMGTTAPATRTSLVYSEFDAVNGTKLYLGGYLYVSLDGIPTKVYVDNIHSYVYMTNVPGQGAIHV
ncbi:hypothetical protein EBQ93_04575, partial [bacterium]|nr:hypothetical protein [bacterium]